MAPDARSRNDGSMSHTETAREAETDPSGVPFAELDPARLHAQRTSIKWDRYPDDVLPLFVAEMDFTIAPEIQRALIAQVEASDIGYVSSPRPLAEAFASFAQDRWGWYVPRAHVSLATDVATGVVESLRVFRPEGGRLVLPVPVYPGFYEMLEELPFETVEIPLASARLDLEAIGRAFAEGATAMILCNPHNPHGTLHSREELTELARLAAQYDVFVVSDEIHAPLTHAGETFTPFAPIAADAGALSVTTTSASKGWSIAGAKCSLIIAADARAAATLTTLPPEVLTRVSILGLHASVAAFRDARDWLDRATAQAVANDKLLARLLQEHLPGVRHTRPRAGYLAWLDFRDAGLGSDPHQRILTDARVALNNGAEFGPGGDGHVRVNLACAPDTLREAIARIATLEATA